MTAPIDISICICTFRRPALLDQLLMALTEQACDGLRVEVVVVDNDPAGSAAEVLRDWQSRMPMPLHARHETTPNIAQARNAAVHTAQGEWVLFIDDDEAPDADWIRHLVHTQREYNADAVFAPVLPRYLSDTPDWIRAGDFFNRRRFATGTAITTKDARTGNVLIRRSKLMVVPGPFDTAFGRTGAEDTMLFRDMLAHGARFIWCDEATVSEEVPAQRANLNWLLRRSYRLGQTYVLSEIARLGGLQRFLRAAQLGVRALIQLLIAAGVTLLALPFSRIAAIRWLRTTLAQCGKLSALAGHRYHEYGN
ncbi:MULTISPECIES: glycosyltransferase family 2 protein [unclassified Herbaspirillum]|uniref:glycosyltransferase n=1 Tax=unclassified Herbaspirillum TaxID=2624150 RepID=UPI000E2FA8A6|nr:MULTISPECIES: glycosyltransferase family 2 protein [unclassified Herbaspirillum]RFB73780.1 glycosyltransferase [Herbaspirillum sp. 3R-3a1]TFI10409.1 glycosyltransferase [Herbaspirillum sp. 3R11]TFI16314.1 glycosyltransferase [Herbaspirillum sp. 3R-11]TFI25724.1 glycosyltransferase [Herbaspirillum sp. 3C11]